MHAVREKDWLREAGASGALRGRMGFARLVSEALLNEFSRMALGHGTAPGGRSRARRDRPSAQGLCPIAERMITQAGRLRSLCTARQEAFQLGQPVSVLLSRAKRVLRTGAKALSTGSTNTIQCAGHFGLSPGGQTVAAVVLLERAGCSITLRSGRSN